MSRTTRIELIKRIEQKRGSKVLAYITGDRQGLGGAHLASDVLPILEHHLSAMVKDATERIDLFLYSRGGHSDTPWSIVTLIRELFKGRSFGVLIPSKAHSAATVIAVGADAIVMTPMAELGPIDATIYGGPHNPRDPNGEPLPMSVEDVRGYMDLLETYRFIDAKERIQAFSHLANQVPPLGLGAVNRLLSQTRKVAEQLLRMRKEELGDDNIKRIVDALASEIGSHSHVIRRSEAREIGIKFAANAEAEGINDELLQLFSEYAKLLELDTPFKAEGELIAEDLEEKTWPGLKLAIVESTCAQHVYKIDVRVTRLREVPPQVTFNLPGLQLEVPQFPEGSEINGQTVDDYIRNLILPTIKAQVDKASTEIGNLFIKSMPQKGFQKIQSNASWRLESNQD